MVSALLSAIQRSSRSLVLAIFRVLLPMTNNGAVAAFGLVFTFGLSVIGGTSADLHPIFET